jgi:hypothetical protein
MRRIASGSISLKMGRRQAVTAAKPSSGTKYGADHLICNHMRPYGLRLGPGGRDGDGFDETDTSDLQSGGGEAGYK